MTELGVLIRNAREDAGLSQEALAARIKALPGKKIDLSKDQISRIESAARKDMLFPAELEAFSVSLGIPQFQMLRALDFEVGPSDGKPSSPPTDPRELAIERLRRIRWTPGVDRSINWAISVLEKEQGIETKGS